MNLHLMMVEWIEQVLRPIDDLVMAVRLSDSLGPLPLVPLDFLHHRDDDSDGVYDADDDGDDVVVVSWMVLPAEKHHQTAHRHHYRFLLARFLLAALLPYLSSLPCHPLRQL